MTLRKRKNGLRCTKDFIPEAPIPDHELGSNSRYAKAILEEAYIRQANGRCGQLTKEQSIKNAMTPPKN